MVGSDDDSATKPPVASSITNNLSELQGWQHSTAATVLQCPATMPGPNNDTTSTTRAASTGTTEKQQSTAVPEERTERISRRATTISENSVGGEANSCRSICGGSSRSSSSNGSSHNDGSTSSGGTHGGPRTMSEVDETRERRDSQSLPLGQLQERTQMSRSTGAIPKTSQFKTTPTANTMKELSQEQQQQSCSLTERLDNIPITHSNCSSQIPNNVLSTNTHVPVASSNPSYGNNINLPLQHLVRTVADTDSGSAAIPTVSVRFTPTTTTPSFFVPTTPLQAVVSNALGNAETSSNIWNFATTLTVSPSSSSLQGGGLQTSNSASITTTNNNSISENLNSSTLIPSSSNSNIINSTATNSRIATTVTTMSATAGSGTIGNSGGSTSADTEAIDAESVRGVDAGRGDCAVDTGGGLGVT